MDPQATFTEQVEWITVKYSRMEKEYNEGTKFYNEKVKPYIVGGKLLELIELNPYLDRLIPSLQQFSDLKNLSEDTIFIAYEAGIQIAGAKKFTGFTKENIEAFYRLKLRSIESRLGQSVPKKVQGIPRPQEAVGTDG